MNPGKAPRGAVRVWQATDHIPAPVEHRGPDPTVYTEDHGIHYLFEEGEAEAYLIYDGPISEVVL